MLIPANLPRSGVVEFVGRGEAMAQLHEMLQQGDRIAVSAIAGMGGIGKTELALQYALAYKQTYAGGLCWLQARSGDVGTQLVRFGQSYLNLNPPDGMELADQVNYCWRNWQAGEVLLVFDDVTDYKVILAYLPPSTEPRFKVLMTTRLRLGQSVKHLELDVLDEAAALELLKSLVEGDRIESQLNDAKRLCEQLGYLPLGLELVGRYLARKADLSVAKVLTQLSQKQLEARALCQTEADMTAHLGVAAAFELSWSDLSTDAQHLGCGLSLFAAAPIPWLLVEQCFAQQDSEELEEWRDDELLKLHLLRRVADSTYRLHPLIREFLRTKQNNLAAADEQKYNYCTAMVAVAKQVPESPTQQHIQSIALAMPHMAEIVKDKMILKNNTILSDEDFCLPFVSLGRFYASQGFYEEAEIWYKEHLSNAKERFGENHLEVASSQNNLANIYKHLGRYDDAESYYKQALKFSIRLLGENDLNVATIMNNLAWLYSHPKPNSELEDFFSGLSHYKKAEKRYKEAEKLFRQALNIRKFYLTENHKTVAQSLSALGKLYVDLGDMRYDYLVYYKKAEQLLQEAFDIRIRTLKEDDPDIAESQNNLAYLYTKMYRYSKAEGLFFDSLRLNKRLLGENHPNVARTLWNLGELYVAQNRYDNAKPLFLQALEILKNCLGNEHPEVISACKRLEDLHSELE